MIMKHFKTKKSLITVRLSVNAEVSEPAIPCEKRHKYFAN